MIKLLLRVLWGLVKDLGRFILVLMLLTYLFSGFGLFLALASLGEIFGGSSTPVVIINSVVLALIVSSWVWFTGRWLKGRIKQEKDKLYVNRRDNK